MMMRALIMGVLFPAAAAAQQSRPAPVPGAPGGVTAFVHVTVVPMDSNRVLVDHVVLVEGGRVVALGPADQVTVPAAAKQIDGAGKYLMPGMVDMHTHVTMFLKEGETQRLEDTLFVTLADGVTTIRNLDYTNLEFRPADLLPLRARAAAGEIWSPRIYTSGQWGPRQYLNPKNQDSLGMPLRMDSIETYLRAYKAQSYDFVKVREETIEVFDSVLVVARRVGIPVVGHSGGSVKHAIEQGLRSIEHINFDDINNTIGVTAAAALLEEAGAWGCFCPPGISMLMGNKDLLVAMRDRGAGLLAGTDGTRFGSMSTVLGTLVRMGVTPYEALAMATVNPARYFAAELHAPDDAGTVAVGKRADLVLLNGNPLTDVGNTKRPAGVMIGGRWLDRAALDQRLAEIKSDP